MATSISFHPSIPVLSPSFLYHPYIPSFKSKDFSFTCNIVNCASTARIMHAQIYPMRVVDGGTVYQYGARAAMHDEVYCSLVRYAYSLG